ncbi:MAG: hypothetical protein ABI999_08700 [Acidobacteriota bacterium]
MENARAKISWKYALGPAVIMAVLAIYPQISLLIAKGSSWHGSYVVSNYDETAYSAYINALVNGKPRENDPFVGVDNTAHESLYSIQFVPAYLIATPTRLFGLSTSTSFIAASLILAVLSAFALYWFLRSVTGDSAISAVGSLFVMCLGTAAAFQGELSFLTRGSVLIDFFPFLRRYQPGFAFPLFFVFCGLVWRSLNEDERRPSLLYALASGTCFALLVFSYFYLWTAAAAAAGCLTIFSLSVFPDRRKSIGFSAAIIVAFAVLSLIPYSIMLSGRSPDLDSVQLLTRTHIPDLLHPTLIIGLLIIVIAGILVYRKRISIKDPKVVLTLSFAVTPLVLFNQQVFTGRSLQPVHYEIFIANYLVLASIVLLFAVVSDLSATTDRTRKLITYVAAASVVWGLVEASTSTSRNALAAQIRDESVPAIRLIMDKQRQRSELGDTPIVLATNFITSDIVPTVSTMRPLWNAHTSSAGGVSVEENKRLFYLYLYYSGYSDKDLSDALASNSFEVTAAIFGSGRALPGLGAGEAIKPSETREEAQRYADFVTNFGLEEVSKPALNYLIVPAKAEPNYSNVDRWYQRDAGETVGLFKVYSLTSKASDPGKATPSK